MEFFMEVLQLVKETSNEWELSGALVEVRLGFINSWVTTRWTRRGLRAIHLVLLVACR
jgi:hypothetical protein